MTSEADELLLRFDQPDGDLSLVLEDDGKAGYAYLLKQGSCVGDVWLYNVGPSPERVDWRDKSQMPFQNPAKYCAAEPLPRLAADPRISCSWFEKGVTISVDGIVWARLEVGGKPGWSRGAGVAGPLAKPLAANTHAAGASSSRRRRRPKRPK